MALCFMFGSACELGPRKPNIILFPVPRGRPQSSKVQEMDCVPLRHRSRGNRQSVHRIMQHPGSERVPLALSLTLFLVLNHTMNPDDPC